MDSPKPNRDIQGKSSRRRYRGKMHHLIRSGLDRLSAVRRARAYAGGKTSPKAGDLFLFETDPGPTVQTLVALGEVGQPIQIAKCGTFKHPTFGDFAITPDDCRKMADNFKANARGVELAVDENHEPNHRALGWFRDVEARDGGLWATVEWNDDGAELLRKGTYRYFSPEFQPNHRDNETGTDHGPTLLGGALTNRPFLKGMEPVALTEVEPSAAALAEGDPVETAAEEDCHEAMLVGTRAAIIDALASYDPVQAVARVLSNLNAYLDADAAEDDAEAGAPDGASAMPEPADPMAMAEPTQPDAAAVRANEAPATPERSSPMTNTATPTPAPADATLALAEVARLQNELALKEQEMNTRLLALAEKEKGIRTRELTDRVAALCQPDANGVVHVTPGQKDGVLAFALALNEQSAALADNYLNLQAQSVGVKLGEVGAGVSAEGDGGSGDNAAGTLREQAVALAEQENISIGDAMYRVAAMPQNAKLAEQARAAATVHGQNRFRGN